MRKLLMLSAALAAGCSTSSGGTTSAATSGVATTSTATGTTSGATTASATGATHGTSAASSSASTTGAVATTGVATTGSAASGTTSGTATTATTSGTGTTATTSGTGTTSGSSTTGGGSTTGGSGTTWYVRADGGTRYSVNVPTGQCNGMANAPYPGTGVNQDCAFNDIRALWTDGSYTTDSNAGSPGWGWIGSGGDTYLIDCPNDCRVGQSGPNSGDYFGLAGNPYGAGAPPPLNGSASAHTRILGANYANCTDDTLKAHVNGGYGVGAVFSLGGASYVDLACFNITDHSACGRSGQTLGCATNYPLDDYAGNGIATSNTTTNVSITDVRIHGMAVSGMLGPTGDGVNVTRVAVVGNPSSGWNMDPGDGTTGTGTLTMSYFSTLWSGCAEEYPIVDALPYQDCADDNSGGYGDGIGTATVTSDPAWIVNIDHSIAAYSTQDGFDLLHLQGNGSRLTIVQSLSYSNMGQQLKVGAASTARNNLLVGNCNALRQAIPGTPAGYDTNLSDFCRASDTAVVVDVQDSTPTYYQFNTLVSANATGLEVDCNGTCTAAATIAYEDNIFLGFPNDAAHGYPGGGNDDSANPIYLSVNGLFSNSGSIFSNDDTFGESSTWTCPNTGYGEVHGLCVDPQLTDDSWHLYGYGNLAPAAGSPMIGAGVAISGITVDNAGTTRPNPPSIGALE